MSTGGDRVTLTAFLLIVGLGGFNGIAIHYSNQELAPFWGATLRFGLASALLFGAVALRRIALPRGRALAGSLIYGLLAFGVTFAFIYYALLSAPPGLAQVILALVPLLTLLLAVAQRLERFRLQSLAGSLLAIVGVVIVLGGRIGGGAEAIPLPAVLAVLVAAVAIAESSVVVKLLPRSHPIANNAVAMAAGAALLFAVALVAGDRLTVPSGAATLFSVGYLVVVGSAVVFGLFLYVIERWTASATSYALLLMPLVAVVASAALTGEPITAGLVGGGVLVVAGVYLGAFAPSISRPLPGLLRRPVPTTATAAAMAAAGPTNAQAKPPELITPLCP
jgi:drug/metabolite transporter (DMT)-like permease